MKTTIRLLFLAAIIIGLASLLATGEAGVQATAQREADAAYTIRLQARQFVPDAGAPDAALMDMAQRATAEDGPRTAHILVQFQQLPDAAEQARLEQSGLRLLSYIPERAWLAQVDLTRLSALQQQTGIRWMGALQSADKLSPDVLPLAAQAQAGDSLALLVYFYNDLSEAQALEALKAYAAEVTESLPEAGRYQINLPVGQLQALLADDGVQWVAPGLSPKTTNNDWVRGRTQTNAVYAAPYGLSGSGVELGIWDGGTVAGHVDFTGRLFVMDVTAAATHATHVAGTMAGSGANSAAVGSLAYQYKGMAPGAAVYSYDWDYSVSEHNAALNTYGVILSQNSWGYVVDNTNCTLYGDYASEAPEYDDVVNGLYGKRPTMVFAVGNDRDDCDCFMSCVSPYINYGTIQPPATAKNVLSVGAANADDDSMTSFSNWGPTDDGRLKPEVVAPGCKTFGGIYSPYSTSGYASMCGTSMAAPAVSGIVALLVEQYRALYSANDPAPATTRAVLAHTADDLNDATSYYNPGPDYASGYGRVNTKAAIDLLRAKLLRVDLVGNGQTDTYYVDVPNGTAQLKVTLAWDDPTGTPNAAVTLVNNLNLTLTAPDGTTVYRTWVLNPANPAANAIIGTDNINNLEQVLVNSPTPGMWTVRVVGASVPQGPQSYSLVGANFAVVTGPPLAFNKLTPVNTVTNLFPVLTLNWTASGGAVYYELCYDTINNDACDTEWVNVGSKLSVGVGILAANTPYYWQARAVNSDGATAANTSAWWRFDTGNMTVMKKYLPIATRP